MSGEASTARISVLISCFGEGETGGGLFLLRGEELQEIDRLSTTGLCLANGHFIRVVRSVGEESPGEILIYDRQGVLRYWRVDELTDPHDIIWDGENFVAASSLSNTLLWISRAGEVVRRWKAPGEGDAWHLNGLLLHDGRLYLSAFGRYLRHREWAEHMDSPTGLILDLVSGEAILTGLTHPHHPRFFDGAWAVCNSRTAEVLQIDPISKQIRKRVQLNAYTRGFAISDEFLYVGESVSRRPVQTQRTASLAILCRKTWEVLNRLSLPCREIYDVLCVEDPELIEGIRKGFRTNPTRVTERDLWGLFDQVGVVPVRLWPFSDPLPPEACRISVRASPPTTMRAGEIVEVECWCRVLAGIIISSAPPWPVHLSYKWLDPVSGAQVPGTEGLRTRLPKTLAPGEDLRVVMRIQAPLQPGEYELRITMVQEAVAWFDSIDIGNACSARVLVTAGHQPGLSQKAGVRESSRRRTLQTKTWN